MQRTIMWCDLGNTTYVFWEVLNYIAPFLNGRLKFSGQWEHANIISRYICDDVHM